MGGHDGCRGIHYLDRKGAGPFVVRRVFSGDGHYRFAKRERTPAGLGIREAGYPHGVRGTARSIINHCA